MKIHEYQAKKLLSGFGVAIAKGAIAYTPKEARTVANDLGSSPWVVKAQIHAGGRGKGGGIKLSKTLEEVENYTAAMIENKLVTPQTGPEGQIVRRVYIEKGCNIKQELYLSLLVDRKTGRVMVIASAAGGMDIEAVADKTPEKIIKRTVDPLVGFQPYLAREISFAIGLKGGEALKVAALISSTYKAFVHYDASLIEINPLVVTNEGDALALDAKMTFDDNGLFRHPEIEELRDVQEEDPAELEAARHSLSYIKLDGNIGCLVNGAGLAMATMDAIKLYGGEPANFLDVGGGAPRERVTTAFKLILSDKNVEGILVNIFGGIMRCDIIAEGIVAAAKDVGIHAPLVVRLEGTNVDSGKKILANSGLAIISADNLGDAAEKIVKAVKEAA
ncbi:ADP-forming succinate--CoA ligase subunit beta [Candidatus Nucleicultrix amoebiphila]|jgi:succinyl-CoA synthetase beta subunit|uniref:Succinate--CoA ligase [ADP-forming] subunit beta n=1 Tax=Candidatus Nucleicultrix amoebiphila FS5 TaxID=1414854 RepID=A0A1W6N2M5_9PROT|nr:ADP-forming succinate--CoA ligase subunit beta [Candidatus Nucleicultrix amoebiphila]ARN84068.1 succinyl-CoA synthetase subunit beta [Candidatus Nucleicultrix amoebiphila FS5]